MADLVSVLMSMRDAELYVREALDSILIESQVPLEVIVVENGSSDDSAEVVSSIGDERIHLVQGPCRTIAEALNAGLEQVRGDIVMRCDADDRYVPGRIARQVEWLESHSDFGAVCGSFVTVDRRGKLISTLDHRQVDEEITDELRSGTTRTHVNTFAIHTELLRDLDGFRPYFVTAEDLDMQLRVANVTRVWYQARSAYEYRLHDASTIHTQANSRRIFFENTAREFAVQRRDTGMDDLQRGRPPAPPAPEGKPQSSTIQQQGMLLGQAWREHRDGRRWQAIKTGWRACWSRPGDWRTWKSFLALAVKR